MRAWSWRLVVLGAWRWMDCNMETLLSRAEIPIIDLQHLGTAEVPVKSSLKRVAAQLHRSLTSKGLALLVNHGIPESKLRAVYNALDQFCMLPKEARTAFQRTPPHNHGYVPPGFERFSKEHVKEMRHTFNVCWLDRNLPEAEVPGFQAVVNTLAQDFRRLALMLLRAIATGLELQMDYFLKSHQHILSEGNESCLRLLYYPPYGTPLDKSVTRCGEHCDYGTFTLLAQDSEGGLEIQIDKDKWGRVGHLPGAILINTGELLSTWTDNKYPALRHRVVIPEQPMVRSKGRHSIAFFVHPDDDTLIEPVKSPVLMEEQQKNTKETVTSIAKNSVRHRTLLTAYQHLQMRFRETYAS